MALQKINKVRPGAPTKLTPELQKKFCGYIREGQFISTAAHLCGVAADTVHLWIRKGNASDSGEYFEFAEAVRKADAESEAEDVRIWKLHDKKDYHSVKDRLQIRHKNWMAKQKIEISGPDGGAIQTQDLSKLSIEELALLKQLLAKAEQSNE